MLRPTVCAAALLTIALAGCGGNSGPGPAANVNGNPISMTAYQSAVWQARVEQVDSIGYDYCGTKGTEFECKVLERQALQGLIDRELVREYAQSHHITISQTDVNRNWLLIFDGKFKGNQAALNGVLKRLHVSEAQYRQSLADDLLQQRVEYAVTAGLPTSVPSKRIAILRYSTRKAARAARAQLAHGASFLVLVTYAVADPRSPCVKTKCGDLGWIPVEFIPSWTPQLRTAATHSVVGPLRVAGGGYVLYYVEAYDPHAALTARQLVTQRQQRFSEWLKQQERRARVTRNVAV